MKRENRKVAAAIGVSTLVTILLTSCAASEPFADAEPASLPVGISDELEPPITDSVRALGEDAQGVQYYTGRWSEKGVERYCLVIVKTDDYAQSCGERFPIVGILGDVRASLSDQAGEQPEAEGAELVGSYLTVTRP